MKKYIVASTILILLFSCGKKREPVSNKTPTKQTTIDSVYAGTTVSLTDTSEGKYYHPEISGNGKYLFFTSQNYQGLWVKFLEMNRIKRLSSGRGAGYRFLIADNGRKIFYRLRIKSSAKRRTGFSLIMQNIPSGKISIIASSEERISPPVLIDGELVYFVGEKLFRKKIFEKGNNKIAFLNFNSRVYAIFPDTVKEIFPEQKNITDISKSPLNNEILFTVRGEGIYAGKIKGEKKFIDSGFSPSWSPDGNLIAYNKEKSDGMKTVNKSIFVAGVNPIKIFNLNLQGEYPVWHPDGKHIIYSSLNGEILQTEINTVYKEEK